MPTTCARMHRTWLEPLEARLCLSAPMQWESRGPGGGGAFFAPSFSPHNASELYVVTDMSEMFHTTNLGAAWSIEDFHQFQAGRQSRVQFTSDPQVLYSLDYTEVDGGQRPVRSTDGGATWSPLDGWDVSEPAYSVWADPNNTTNLVVSDYTSVWFSNNGGSSFASKYTAPSDGDGCFVAGAFFDGANIYLGTNRGLLVSNNSGTTFAPSSVGGIPAAQSIFSFAGARQNGTTRFFAVTFASGSVYPSVLVEGEYNDYQSIYSLDVGQANWTPRTTGIPASDRPGFVGSSIRYRTAFRHGQIPPRRLNTNAAKNRIKIV